jgi:pantoate--beta-alanine ligase
MKILHTVAETRAVRRALRLDHPTESFGLVPTMGALHDGHLALVRAARQQNDRVAVSLFVNPLQFGPNEDLAKYPRAFEADCALLEREDVDYLFAPASEEMYPRGAETLVDVPGVGSRLDGASRPGHFCGVTTVVSKLFHALQPDRAYFGQKDAAQVAVLRAMVRDLNFDVDLVVCPTVRDADGLALSSRNRYLTVLEREQALAIPKALQFVRRAIVNGQRDASLLREALHEHLAATSGLRLDYAELVHADTLEPVDVVATDTLVAVAAFVGSTRLIDNFLVAEPMTATAALALPISEAA